MRNANATAQQFALRRTVDALGPSGHGSAGFCFRTRRRLPMVAKVASRGYLGTMRAIGLKILKNKLSEYVRLAAGGEVVLITDRDRVVAELTPPQQGRSANAEDAQLAELMRAGLLTPPTIGPHVPLPPMRPVMRYAELAEDLAKDRDDR